MNSNSKYKLTKAEENQCDIVCATEDAEALRDLLAANDIQIVSDEPAVEVHTPPSERRFGKRIESTPSDFSIRVIASEVDLKALLKIE